MNSIEPRVQGQVFTLGQVCLKFIVEFKLPQSDQQDLSELWEIQQREGESAWEYNKKFKDACGGNDHCFILAVSDDALRRRHYKYIRPTILLDFSLSSTDLSVYLLYM